MKNKLKVWWMPQVPSECAFEVEVDNLKEAHLLLETLAQYDSFQYEHNIKPDYCNTGGLLEYHPDLEEWLDWEDERTGEDFDEYRTRTFMEEE